MQLQWQPKGLEATTNQHTSAGYESYDCETALAKSEPTSKETQPPVSSALVELAEEFTQLALLGKLTQMKKMVDEHAQASENTSRIVDIVNMQNERQQTVNLISAR